MLNVLYAHLQTLVTPPHVCQNRHGSHCKQKPYCCYMVPCFVINLMKTESMDVFMTWCCWSVPKIVQFGEDMLKIGHWNALAPTFLVHPVDQWPFSWTDEQISHGSNVSGIIFGFSAILSSTALFSWSGSVAEWLACWTQVPKARVQITASTLSGNSLRQTVHTQQNW